MTEPSPGTTGQGPTSAAAPLALSVATRFTGDYALAGTYHEQRFAAQTPELVSRAAQLVEEETGLRIPDAEVPTDTG